MTASDTLQAPQRLASGLDFHLLGFFSFCLQGKLVLKPCTVPQKGSDSMKTRNGRHVRLHWFTFFPQHPDLLSYALDEAHQVEPMASLEAQSEILAVRASIHCVSHVSELSVCAISVIICP